MPARNWQQGGSFPSPLTLLLEEPDSSPLVQLPCINQTWVLAIMGCLDQLRNPSTWDPASSPAAIDGMLSRVTKLQEMMWGAMDVPCCNVTLRLHDCVLQFSTDGGATWTDTAAWTSGFCGCVAPCVTPPIPTFPPGQVVNQHACNISGYIAQRIIEITMQKVAAYVGTTGQQLVWANEIMAALGFDFPVTAFAFNAFVNWYQNVVSQVLSQVTFVGTDVVFWSDVTCAIYSAIRTLGYVDGSNYGTAESNLAAISYTYPWAVAAVAAFWNDVGLQNIQAMQNAGALDDIDCSGCPASWCYYFDFTVSNGGFVPVGSYGSHWVSGQGWEGFNFEPGHTGLYISFDMTVSPNITRIDLQYITNQGATSGQPHYAAVSSNPGVTNVCQQNIPFATLNTLTWENAATVCAGRYIVAVLITASAGAGYVTLAGLQVHGTGVNPFGPDNCVH